jgi:hypothetical protein
MPKVKAETARYVLWTRGNLSFKLHDGQKVIEKSYQRVQKKLFVANCSRRFGKTFWLVVKAIECALTCKNSNPKIKIASSHVTTLEEYILPAFREVLHDCPEELWAGWETGFLKSKNKFIFPNGAEIKLVGLDKNPEGLRGNYCDLYIIDEAGIVEDLKKTYSSVIAPQMLTRPDSRILMLSTPSMTPAHDFSYFCDLAIKQKAYVKLTIFDNPMMTEDLIASAKEECLTESDWRREYLCEHVVDEQRAIVPEWNKKFIQDLPRPEDFKYLDRYVSMDLGVKVDLTAVLFGYYDVVNDRIVIEDEFDMNGPQMTTPDLVAKIRKVEHDLWPDMPAPYKRIADNNNPMLLQDLGYIHGLYFGATNKDELHAMVNDLRRVVKEGRLFIKPNCSKTIGSIEAGIWDKHRKKFDRSARFGHFDHLAALVYFIRNVDFSRNEVPKYKDAQGPREWRREQQEKKEIVNQINKLVGLNKRK